MSSIDSAIAALTAALNANTAALLANAGAAPAAAEKPATGKGKAAAETKKADEPKVTQEQVNVALIKIKDAFGMPETKKADEPKVTQEQVNVALIKIKDAFGMPEAKTVIKEFGLVDKMADIKPAQFKAVLEGAIAKFDELTAAAETAEDKTDDL